MHWIDSDHLPRLDGIPNTQLGPNRNGKKW